MQLVRTRDNIYFLEPLGGSQPRECYEAAADTMPAVVGDEPRTKAPWDVFNRVYDKATGVPYEASRDEKTIICECETRERLRAIGVPPILHDCSFENYDQDQEFQRRGYKAAYEFANRDTVAGFMALVGTPGTGKDHLSVSVIRAFKGPSIFISFTELVAGIHAGYENGTAEAFMNRHRDVPLLVLSEVGQHGEKLARDAHEILYRILGHRYDYFLPTVLTSNLRAAKAGEGEARNETTMREFLGDRIASRISQALVCSATMYGADYRATPKAKNRYLEQARQNHLLSLLRGIKAVTI
jgi:DNA replication protein DnaC